MQVKRYVLKIAYMQLVQPFMTCLQKLMSKLCSIGLLVTMIPISESEALGILWIFMFFCMVSSLQHYCDNGHSSVACCLHEGIKGKYCDDHWHGRYCRWLKIPQQLTSLSPACTLTLMKKNQLQSTHCKALSLPFHHMRLVSSTGRTAGRVRPAQKSMETIQLGIYMSSSRCCASSLQCLAPSASLTWTNMSGAKIRQAISSAVMFYTLSHVTRVGASSLASGLF